MQPASGRFKQAPRRGCVTDMVPNCRHVPVALALAFVVPAPPVAMPDGPDDRRRVLALVEHHHLDV